MRGVSTFGAFTTARLGIFAAQKGLDVTGHNITNINTSGYSRQRLDQMSLRVGGTDRYSSSNDTIIGSGVLCTGVSQLRDPYLDIRFRNEQASVGSMDAKLAGLDEITSILDEVSKGDGSGIVEAQFNDLVTQLENLSLNAGKEEFDGLVRSSANSLVKLFNNYAQQLNTVSENQELGFRQDIDTVNTILRNIGDLNDSILKSEIHGDSALELKDQRNLLIDDLSSYAKINVEYKSVSIGAGKTVDQLMIHLAGTPGGNQTTSRSTLVDGNFAAQLSVRQLPTLNPAYDPAYDNTVPGYNAADPKASMYLKKNGDLTNDLNEAAKLDSSNYDLDLGALTDAKGRVQVGSAAVALGDLDLFGSLQATREILTEAGEFTANAVVAPPTATDSGANSKRGIPYYQKSLDSLAQKLASVLNTANSGYMVDGHGNYVNKSDGKPLVYDDGDPLTPPVPLTKKDLDLTLPSAQKTYLEAKGQLLGGPLFSNSSNGNATSNITAANISISKSWSVGDVRVLTSKVMGSTNGTINSTANDNIMHTLILMDGKQSFVPNDTAPGAFEGDIPFFNGSFQEMLTNISGTLANDVKSTSTLLNNYASSATEISVSRDSVSGVDLNDEATSLMQYQKSYSAACRLMTTLDEALDKLINGTGMVGR